MTRTLLSKHATLVSRDFVWQTDDALEVESNEHYEVTQRRVFYDDVVQITLHREYGLGYLLLTGGAALLFLGFGALIVVPNLEMWPIGLFFAMFGVPALVAFLVRAMFGLDVITVFGRRSKAVLKYRVRKARAREVFEQLCATVAKAQRPPQTTEPAIETNTELAEP